MIERLKVRSIAELRAAYDAIYARAEFGEKQALYAQVLRLLEAKPGERVLDVGCGAGPFGQAAAGLRVTGVDIAREALKKARARGASGLVLAQGERLPVRDRSFSRIVCLGNLEHFIDPRAGALELRRVLEPGGRCVVMLPNRWYSGDLWRLLRTGRGPDHHQPIDRFATLAEWRRLLEQAGLVVLAVERWDKAKRWKRLFPLSLAYHFVFQVTTRI